MELIDKLIKIEDDLFKLENEAMRIDPTNNVVKNLVGSARYIKNAIAYIEKM